MRRSIFEDEHSAFRESARTFFKREAVPHTEEWETAGLVDRSFWTKAAESGFVGFEAPEQYGGLGLNDFRFNAILNEEVAYAGAVGDNFSLENDIICPYLVELTNDEQKERWLPRFTRGDAIVAIAMTEPGAGSDLQAMSAGAQRDGDEYILNGSKTFVTSGIQADLVIVAARTARSGGRHGFSLLDSRGRHGGLRPRPQARQDRPPRPGHGGALLQPGPRAGGEPARRGGHGPLLPEGGASARAPLDRRGGRGRRGARPGADARLRP